MKSSLTDFSSTPQESSPPYAANLEVDVLIVGAGFSGIFCLHKVRKQGLSAVIYEAGKGIGGTWQWNCYPGAMVDSEVPVYQFSIPETWQDWTWSSNYPDYKELRAYFDHVDKVLEISKDCAFGSVVVGAHFNHDEVRWHISTADGRTARAKYLIVAAGFSAKRYIPDWEGLDRFQGVIHHSSFWPEKEVDVHGKRCAVIGTGASGVQLTQAWGPVADSVRVFQRTPNLTLPMRRRLLSREEQEQSKAFYPDLFCLRERTFGGFLYTFVEKTLDQDSEEEQQAFLEKLWEAGGFRFWLQNYKDYLFDAKTNRVVYDFWAKKVRQGIDDPRKRDILAPLVPHHHFGIKRPALQNNYYEQFNRPTVDVVNIKENPIVGLTKTGIQLQDGTVHEVDIIGLATGFDAVTGGITEMGIQSIHGSTLKDDWKAAARTYLGLTVSGYPNMFNVYGTHGPTLLSNGPTAVEIQCQWVVDAIKQMERQGIKYLDATEEASQQWKAHIDELSNETLLPTTRSTYMGSSILGKAFEQTCYAGGMFPYTEEIRAVLPTFKGFRIVRG
ncbi:hypothetical protein ASPZODRAFT_1543128 [Penicilliopsis zonata CBS 506.65]|uniref:FAD/NAD(P)-binding domain-containing protein n=1 Tax=Penicilliopsis zonata CBS 506.65 TaxID=1073090 RepID=A0A1L9SM13_9EURO|nr:hypothetical protein ASPZODRAFT_1543128 [Penicilliopsis zonata CBS 506.65]OJJ48230.1 hypothetical protein ASPZODRAFT_1543128 [Penicilliopsis zonata CBS 506.65]